MKNILLTLMVFGIVGCSSELKFECKYNPGTHFIVSGDQTMLTVIKNGFSMVYYQTSISSKGIIQFENDSVSPIQYDTIKKNFKNLKGCIQV